MKALYGFAAIAVIIASGVLIIDAVQGPSAFEQSRERSERVQSIARDMLR